MMFSNTFRLDGLNALVCGGSQGIGAATAQCLAEMGARVTILARNETNLNRTLASLLPVKSGPHLSVCADLSEPTTAIELLTQKWNIQNFDCQILVNNSGGPASGKLIGATPMQFRDAIDQHLIASQLLLQHIAPGMQKRSYGRVINVLSTSVRIPLPNLGVSNVVRSAMASWSKTLAAELAPDGITVNCVLPGYTNTQRLQKLSESAGQVQQISSDEVQANWKKTVPMGRFADPIEVAGAVCYLASPWASYVTGQSICVDGGRTGSL
jgi:3-oxoacyl-[acyl-carrier protein] reductase